MNRSEFLLKAETYINGKRAEDYGDVKINHQQIADIWSVILGTKVTSDQVLSESKFPTLIIGGIRPASIIAICFANVDSANTSPLRGPVCVNILVVITVMP